jgi:hypothetical protein
MPCNTNISEIRACRLNANKIDQAFPLARELKENITLETWRNYAETYLGPTTINRGHRGIIAAEYRDCIRGLLSYDVLTDLVDLTTLAVRDVIVLGMPAGQPAARSLLQQLFSIAAAHQCSAIRIDLSESMTWLAREWSDPEGELFRFPVICFLPGSTVPAPAGATWQSQVPNPSANLGSD